MPAQPLTDATLLDALRIYHAHDGHQLAAARACGMNRSTLMHRVREGQRRGLRADADTPVGLPYERAWAAWQQAIGALEDRYAGPCARAPDPAWRRVLVVSDLHAPFHEPALVARALQEDADLCVINGDLGDQYGFSRFTQYERVPFERELAATTLLLEQFSARYPAVQIVQGNHDARLEKHLRERLGPDLIDAILFLTDGVLDPVRAVAKKFSNVSIVGHTSGRHQLSWMTQIGDAVLLHAEKFSITPGAALRKIEEWLSDMEGHLGLGHWRLALQSHTHQLSMIPWHADKLLVETGCLCEQHGYQMSPRIGGRPQRRGYVTFRQRVSDGWTDLNSVRLVWLDVEARPAA